MNLKRRFVGILILFIGSLGFAKDGFEYYGSWSNVQVSQSEDPHAEGYTLILWKYQGKPIGFLYKSVGPVADSPMGALGNVVLDEKSGNFSFSTKMTIGSIHDKASNKWIPSKDSYSFSGKIKGAEIKGTFSWQNQQMAKPAAEQVILKPKAVDFESNDRTYDEWKLQYDPAFKARGPKW
jgi:hypothetical protein